MTLPANHRDTGTQMRHSRRPGAAVVDGGPLMTVAEMAQMLHIGQTKAWEIVRGGHVRVFDINPDGQRRTIRIRPSDVEKYLRDCVVPNGTPMADLVEKGRALATSLMHGGASRRARFGS